MYVRSSAIVVAPFMGVWIEITYWYELQEDVQVAPFMGVWIEIIFPKSIYKRCYCRTLYGCVD